MANKIIFIGLIVALLHVASAEEANPEPYMNDAPLTIYVDAGKEIDQFLSLAKSIDGKLSVLGDALESITQKVSKLERRELRNQQTRRMLVEVKATAERMSAEVKATEERCTQKASEMEKKLEDLINLQTKWMSAEIKATEERCTQKVSELERKLEDLINPQTNSSAVATRPKRPAELACEKTHDLRSAGIHNNTIPYEVHLVIADGYRINHDGVLIEKRFLFITTRRGLFLHSNIKKLEFSFSDRVVSKKIKKVHTVAENWPHSIILVELDSDVDYNYWLYPTCLYTSELNPKNALMHDGKTLKIAVDSKCYSPYSQQLSPFEICVNGDCGFSDLVFLVEEETTPQLFGYVNCYGDDNYYTVDKMSPYLDLIENIVWPNNGK